MIAVGDVVDVLRKGYKGRTGTVQEVRGTSVEVVFSDTGKWAWFVQDEVRRRRPFEVDDEPPIRLDTMRRIEREYRDEPEPYRGAVVNWNDPVKPRGLFQDKYTGEWREMNLREYFVAIGWTR